MINIQEENRYSEINEMHGQVLSSIMNSIGIPRGSEKERDLDIEIRNFGKSNYPDIIVRSSYGALLKLQKVSAETCEFEKKQRDEHPVYIGTGQTYNVHLFGDKIIYNAPQFSNLYSRWPSSRDSKREWKKFKEDTCKIVQEITGEGAVVTEHPRLTRLDLELRYIKLLLMGGNKHLPCGDELDIY